MRKYLTAIITSLLVLASFGCTHQEIPVLMQESPVPALKTKAQPMEIASTRTPEVCPVFWFENLREHHRLCKQQVDGTGLEIITDEPVYAVQSDERQVCYLKGNGTLCRLDPETGQTTSLGENVRNYALYGDQIVCVSMVRDEKGQAVYPYTLVDTHGNSRELFENDQTFVSFDGRYVLFTSRNGENGETLNVYNIENQQVDCIYETDTWFAGIFAAKGRVFFETYRDEETAFHEYDLNRGTLELCDYQLERGDKPVYYADDTIWVRGGTGTNIVCIAKCSKTQRSELYACPGEEWLETVMITEDQYIFSRGSGRFFGMDEDAYYYVTDDLYALNLGTDEVRKITAPGESARRFTHCEFPRIEGVLRQKSFTRSLYEQFCLTQQTEGLQPAFEQAEDILQYLADGKIDFALVSMGDTQQLSGSKQQNVEVEMKPYARDGLLFVGNRLCGVEDLTREQVMAIYTGEITNWQQLGGINEKINVYYPAKGSLSRSFFEEFLFPEGSLPDFDQLGFLPADERSTMPERCREDPYAFGSCPLYELPDLQADSRLVPFEIDGSLPEPGREDADSYPYAVTYCAVIRADEAQDSPARRLFDWFDSSLCDLMVWEASQLPLKK